METTHPSLRVRKVQGLRRDDQKAPRRCPGRLRESPSRWEKRVWWAKARYRFLLRGVCS